MSVESIPRESSPVIADCVIERQIASSPHATVFFARRHGEPVALKLARADGDPIAPTRLAREASALRRIDHPCVSPLLDAGTWIDGSSYLVTRWVTGTLLEERLRTGPMPWPDIAAVLFAVAQGLGALHSAGIVHRDIKPTNIILPAAGQPRAIILDLGHSVLLGEPRITQSGAAVGSLLYMAPEQVRGAAPDRRADLHALGVILYRALTGALPFDATQVLHGELVLVPPRRRAPEVEIPIVAEDLCRWLLATKPAERLPSAHVLALTLAASARVETR